MKRLVSPALISAAALAVSLSACTGKSEADLMASAENFIQKGEMNAAAIELKSALQRNPTLAKARFQLGQILLQGGDIDAAEIEFRKARDQGHSATAVAPWLAKVMLAKGQNKQILSEFGSLTVAEPPVFADLHTSIGIAAARLGDRARTDAEIAAALEKVPGFAPALLLQARVLGGAGDIKGALAVVAKVVEADPKNVEAWQLRGDLHLLGLRNQAAAMEDFRKVLALRPDHVAAHAILIDIHFAQNDIKAARAQFDALKAVQPNHPQTRMLEAQQALVAGETEKAAELVNQSLRSAPNNLRVLQLASLVALQRNALASAESHLTKVLSLAPELVRPRILLAQTYLRSGQAAKALDVLRPALDRGVADTELLSLAAEAHLQMGDTAESEAYFKRAAKLSPDDPKVRTALALTQMGKGRADVAFGELRQIAASDKGTLAELTMIGLHLRRGETEQALKAIDLLEQKDPGKAQAPNLRGQILVQRRDANGARKNFELALSRDAVYFPAVANLAAMEVREGKPAEAVRHFETLLKADERNVQALVALAEVRAKTGASKEEVAGVLERAVNAAPSNPIPRAVLVDHWLNHGDAKRALTLAQAAAATLPDSLESLDALGRAQMASGDLNQAISTFNKAAGVQPKSPLPHLRLADAHLLSKNLQASEAALRRALDLSPGLLRAQRGLIAIALQGKRPQVALQIAREVQKQRPDDATGFVLEADILAHARNWPAAAVVLRQAVGKRNPGWLASRLYYALVASKKQPEAEAFATEWLGKNPADLEFIAYLGDAAMARQDYAAAEGRFREVLRQDANNASAKNNLAWVLVKLKKPGALELARQAQAASPNEAAVLDTLSLALAAENQIPEAIKAAQRARELAPSATGYRLNLAKLYIRAGDKAAARTELEPLVKLGDKLREQAEVRQLMNGL